MNVLKYIIFVFIRLYNKTNRAFMSTEKFEISTFTEVVEMSSNRLISVPLFHLLFCFL